MRAKEILNNQQGVAEGATVTRIDSKPITDFASNLNTYKHTDDWSQSGLDTGDDSYWTKRNIKPNTSKGLFAGDPHRTALYATGNANETRYVEYTENGQPVVYFDKKDLPAIRARKTYLSVFDASEFRKLPSGEWFSEHPGKPIKQIPINDPFKYIESQGWKIRITNDLNKVLKKVQQLQKVGKIDHYGAEGMNESKQDIARGHLKEDVGGNYLYYSVESSDDAKLILSSGFIEASSGAQTATRQQTKLPVVSVSRSIYYAVSGANVERDYQVVFVLDRNAIESRYKTFGTSQHEPTKSDDIFWNANSANYKKFQKYSKIDTNRDGKMSDQELDAYYAIPGNTTAFDERPNAVMAQIQNKQYATLFSKYNRSKSGKEFEEVIPVKGGQLPLKGILVGFYLVPNKAAAKDQELLNHPMRLTMPRPNTFVKVTQQSVAEDSLKEIDRRGFLRGMGAAAATAAGPGMAQTIPDWQKKANIALQKGPAQKWPGYDEDDGKWPAAKNAPAGSLIAYRGDTRTGKLETLPTLIRKETVAQFLNAYKLCRDNKLLPSISPETWAALLLVEGRSDFGYNGPDILKKYSVTPAKQSNLTNVSYTANQNNVNDKFGPKMDVNLNMTPIRQGLKKLGISENDWRTDFCELLSLKIDTAKRLGIPFYQAWNGGAQFLNRYRLQMQAIKDPKNKPFMDFIRGILGGGQGVAEGNLNEIYKMPPTKNSSQGMTVWAYNDAIEKKSPVVYQKNNVVIFRANNDLLRYIVLQDNQPVLYIGFTKFLDGYKSGTVATEMAGRGKGLAQQAYLNASEILGVPIYSDSTQTDASRLGIWNKLIQQYPNRVVGYDQKSGSDLPLEITDQGPVVNQNQPIYVDRKSSKNNQLISPNDKSRTRLLKLLPNTQQGVAEGTVDESSIPVYKSPSQFYAGAGKTLYKLFRNAFPNLPEHVANDIYNQTSPGTNDTIVNALKQGQDPKSVFLNYYSGITFNFSKDPGTSLTPKQMKTVLLNGRWGQKILTVNPADFAEHSRNRMVKRNFGINPDEDPNRIQRQQSRAKGDGSNEPVIIIQTSNGLILWEGFHRTMSILALGKNGSDPLKWNKVKLRAWVVTFQDSQNSEQGVAETAVPGSVTFAGKDPNEFKSPKGGKPVMVIQTEQGSRYLITSDGMVLRHKSVHANTGGEDAGLKDWSDKIEFYDRSKPLIAGGMQPLSFPDAVAHLADQGRIALSTGKSGARVAVILDNGNWRPATIADAMPKAAAAKPEWAKIVIKADAGTWGSQPKLGWQPLDYNQRGDGTLNRVHNGSPVSHGAKVAQGVAEAWSEKYKKSINCKNPKGFSQRAHCQGRKKNNEQVELDERKRKLKKKTARYYYGPAYYYGATDTGAEGGDGGGLEEDWKKSLANVGLAGAIGLGAAGGMALKDKVKSAFTKPTIQTTQPVQAKPQQVQVSPITNNPLETYLMDVAKKAGLTGIELAQFLGQCAHETLDYKRMIERGTPKYFNKYELKFSPDKAKNLGNIKSGDGIKYKGRGYIQLTGRYNYKMAGKALNLPLEQNPDLAAQPEIAAKIALWYWIKKVKPEIENFADTTSVTRKINPGLSGLEDRHQNFVSYIAQR